MARAARLKALEDITVLVVGLTIAVGWCNADVGKVCKSERLSDKVWTACLQNLVSKRCASDSILEIGAI